MNAFLQSPFGLQPHLTPRFGAQNPFISQPMPLGAPGRKRKVGAQMPTIPQKPMQPFGGYMPTNAFMGMVRPY